MTLCSILSTSRWHNISVEKEVIMNLDTETKNRNFNACVAILAALIGGAAVIVAALISAGVFGRPPSPTATIQPFPSPSVIEPTTTRILEATNTSSSVVVPTSTCSSLPGNLGSGKGFSVTLQKGCHYHFNVACSGCSTD